MKPGLFLFRIVSVDHGPHVGANITNLGRRLSTPSMCKAKSVSPSKSLGFAARRSMGGIATNPAPSACSFNVPFGPSNTDKKSALGPCVQKSKSACEHLDRSTASTPKSASATSKAAADGPNALAANVRTSCSVCIPGMRSERR